MDRKLLKWLRSRGFTITRRRSGHYKLTSPEGRVVFTAGTPSDHRSRLNLAADLARIGHSLKDGQR